MFDLNNLSIQENLRLFKEVLQHLKLKEVLRSNNNPTGDYAEWLSSRVFNLDLAVGSEKGFDAIGITDGKKYQIKGRRSDKPNNSVSLSVIRGIEEKRLDFLLAIVFDAQFTVVRAYKIPHVVVEKRGKYKEYVNGVILSLNTELSSDPGVEDVSEPLKSFIPAQS